jgi:cation/acetate symporter
MVLLGPETIQQADRSGNLTVLLLSHKLGGSGFLGFISAVSFATILAVVAGLTLSGASTFAHDIWAKTIKKGQISSQEELKIAKITTVFLGLLAMILGIIFEGQNVAVIVGLAFSIAASSNFPALILCLFWKRTTTQGVVSTILCGTVGSIIFILLSPTVMVEVMGFENAIIPFKNPGIFMIPLSFMTGIFVSLGTRDEKSLRTFQTMKEKMY